ncbi:hypothetical protein [Nocardioides palaemonis]|uniref:hypothetical protein n=1 Tax=Nocardioides palaemonis TaxID=2829810 RepID=UPI00201131BE|nr:hypothetical protein [Nocardioides palaemonis]
MSTVVLHNVVSLDGYVARPDDDPGPLFDITHGWEGRPPAGDHVVVVSHRPKPGGWHPEASYHFVDDVTSAVATARELAGNGRSRSRPATSGARRSPSGSSTRSPWTTTRTS